MHPLLNVIENMYQKLLAMFSEKSFI